MTDSMIERVARALCKITIEAENRVFADSGLPARNEEEIWHLYVGEARAAIEAMREPTETQYSAGYDATRLIDGTPKFADAGFVLGHAGDIYRAMIDAALSKEAK